tara:strand:+ start:4412 stop:5044 length:633 start_codon:yes stop_codon:yes gene_type:complete
MKKTDLTDIQGKLIAEQQREKEKATIKAEPLPKRDFPNMIAHDKLYIDALSQELEHRVIKLEIMSEKCQLVPKTKQGVIDNIDLLTDFSIGQREMYEIKGKLNTIKALVLDKENHYQGVFLPQYQLELNNSNKHFKSMLKEAKEIIEKKEDKFFDVIKDKIRIEIEVYDEVTEETTPSEERNLHLYKPLKRLVGHYRKLEKTFNEKDKYK